MDLTEAIEAGRAAVRHHYVCDPDASPCSCYDVAITAAVPLIEKAVRQQVIRELRNEATRALGEAAADPAAPGARTRRRYYSGMDLAADFLEHGNAPQGP